MRILIVVPSTEQLKTAGVRIRYLRLQPAFKALGHSLKIKPITTIPSASKINEDVVIISKVYDVRALLLMKELKDNGKIVGVDFFDNYFTHAEDPRLVRVNDWSAAAADGADFAMCATEKMKDLLDERLLHGKPCHIMPDPYERFAPDFVASRIRNKLDRLSLTQTLHIGWFGIAKNPYFPVGLADLYAFKDALAVFRNCGYKVQLTIMSNFIDQNAEILAMLAKLNIAYTVEEWSEEGEQALIERCLICFIPVNAQSFSTVKSLNRAISAFCHGAQVLSTGYPLYNSLHPFIYREAAKFLLDLKTQKLLVRSDTIPQVSEKLQALGDPNTEARSLVDALALMPLEERSKSGGKKTSRSVIVVGRGTPNEILNYIKASEHLVVASPYSQDAFDWDLSLSKPVGDQWRLSLSEKAYRLLPVAIQSLSEKSECSDNPKYSLPMTSRIIDSKAAILLNLVENRSKFEAHATYDTTMRFISEIIRNLFGNISIYFSEWEAPFRPRNQNASQNFATNNLTSDRSAGARLSTVASASKSGSNKTSGSTIAQKNKSANA